MSAIIMRIARILDSGRKRRSADLTPMVQALFFLVPDLGDCIIVTIERTVYSARRFVKVSFLSSALVIAAEKQVPEWTAIKTYLLPQIDLGLCRNACLFSCIQLRISLTAHRTYISHSSSSDIIMEVRERSNLLRALDSCG